MRLPNNAMVGRHLSAAAAVVLVAVGAAGCGRSDPGRQAGLDNAKAPPARVLRRGIGGEPGTLDPHKADDTFAFEILRDLYEGLTVSAPSGDVVPGGAASWSITEGGLLYTFRLRAGLKWSNGDPLVADHFVAGLRRAVDPSTAAPGAELLSPIVNAREVIAGRLPPQALGVTAVDPLTIEIRLAGPCPYLPDILTNSVAVPLHPAARFPAPDGAAVSNGAFTLVSAAPGAPIELRRNPNYWNSVTVTLPGVTYIPLPDESVEFNRFRAGEVDVTNNVPTARFQELSRDRDVNLQVRPTLATFFYAFNSERGPFHSRPGLREALALVVDREAIVDKVTRAGQVPAYSLVPPGVWNYESPAFAWRSLDRQARLARARALYAAAGYSSARPLRIRVVYNQNELIKSVTLATAAAWQEALGVETELIQLEYRVFLDTRADRSQWDVIRLGWSADYNDATSFLDTFMADSSQNHGGWSNAGFDDLVARAHDATDIAARRVLLQQAEAILLADHALLPVYFYVTRRLVQPDVAGAELNPLNRNYSRNFHYTR